MTRTGASDGRAESSGVPLAQVPVRKERAGITDGNVGDALDAPAISEEEHEVVLHEERAVVENDVTPVERVRLGTETTTEQEQVTEEVRKENVELEGDVDRKGGTGRI